jgi:hypothetical protein
MIYVVSGYRRCGTSAMMHALGAGGIPLITVPDIEQMNCGINGYKPNPGGLYEVGRNLYMEPGILIQLLQHGRAIKIFFDGLPILPKGEYRIIYMRRDPQEIQKSLDIALDNVRTAGWIPSSGGRKPFDIFSPYAQKEIDWVLGICETRSDMELSIVDYADLVERPGEVLEGLALPIDVDAAAKVIDRKFYRTRGKDYGRFCMGSI